MKVVALRNFNNIEKVKFDTKTGARIMEIVMIGETVDISNERAEALVKAGFAKKTEPEKAEPKKTE